MKFNTLNSMKPFLLMGCLYNHKRIANLNKEVSAPFYPYLHTQTLDKKIRSLPLDLNLFNVEDNSSDQIKIAKAVESLALPFYKEPMPRESSYYNTKTNLRIRLYKTNKDTYQSHLNNIAKQKAPARGVHGSMHCARTTLWTQVLSRLYEKLGQNAIENAFLLGITAAFHDAARESEGTDYWDEESSVLIEKLLERAGQSQRTSDKYVQAIRNKDPQNGQFSSSEQRLVHDADCLEIIRVIGKQRFTRDFLCFYQFDAKQRALCDQLIDEVARFIFLTENFEVSNFLEHKSHDFYGDLIRMLFVIQEKDPKKFPLITKLIEDDMREILKVKETESSKKALRILESNPIQLFFLIVTGKY